MPSLRVHPQPHTHARTHLHDEGEERNHGQAAVLELGERPVLADAVGGEAEGVEADVCWFGSWGGQKTNED